MNPRPMHRCYTRFPRTSAEGFKDASYADPFDRPAPRSPLARWALSAALAFLAFYLMVKA